ncbi:MAG: PAS domain S-box protein [Dehalococcoidia bacterium]|jgi:PAS domain S-box-containing protein|nr:PAS domain S-box protein [Dehalococcoidia bacterium]
MQLVQNYHIHIPLAALLAALLLVVLVARHRRTPIAATFSVLMSSVAVWSLAAVLEHASPDLPDKIFWMKMSYLGILLLPPAWLALTLQYANRERWLTRRNLAVLAVLPIITLVMVWTNDTHHLMWTDIWLDTSFSPPVDAVTHGAWFWIQAAYAYLLLLMGTLALLGVLLQSPTVYRKQVVVMLLGALVPWVANFLYISGIGPFQAVDPTPLAFAITGAAFSWGLFRLQLLNIMPVAHEAVFRNMVDGVIVLDTSGRIVELNPAAQHIIGRERAGLVGQPYGLVLPESACLIEPGPEAADSQGVMSVGEGQTLRRYVVGASRIMTKGRCSGHLVLLHDDTARARTEMESRERVRLEAELTERRRSEQVLRASEARYRNLVENAAIGILVCRPDGTILSANRAVLEVFGYDSEEEIVETSVVEFYENPEDRRRLLGPIETTGVVRGLEVRMKRKAGVAFWASLNVIVQTAESGERQHLALVEDVTERKQAEKDVAESRENLRLLAQRVEQAREEERTTIARELHDQVGQTLTALKLDIGRLKRTTVGTHPETIGLLDGMETMVTASVDDVRRISSELRPGALDDLGLAGAIGWQLDQLRPRTDITLTFSPDDDECSLDAARTTALFRVFQELVTNVVRHAGAKTARVSLGHEDGACVLTVVDDGCGIDARKISDRHSLGIVGMRERLLPYGGELHIESAPGRGTKARVVMPSR